MFDRTIKVGAKKRLRDIRKAILEQLGVDGVCTARIYKMPDENKSPAAINDEKKDENALAGE